ncbi:hypothetical protein [Pseudanabaena sp. PCC 6802]|nr:hypothetical protein [Pseudanabaena sp. PCC 6802]
MKHLDLFSAIGGFSLAALGKTVVPAVAAAVRIPKGIALQRVLYLDSVI